MQHSNPTQQTHSNNCIVAFLIFGVVIPSKKAHLNGKPAIHHSQLAQCGSTTLSRRIGTVRLQSRQHFDMSFYDDAATSGCSLSSMVAFSRSLAASVAASFSWESSAPALALPLVGLRPFSVAPLAVSASASRRSISACALATF